MDEKEEALARLGDGWRGAFIVGHGMDAKLLEKAGIENADAVVVSTNGDNTNIVVAQVAKQRFEVPLVVVRILDPIRAQFYAQQGMKVVCPTQTAIDQLTDSVLTVRRRRRSARGGGALMYAIVAGGGKVGTGVLRRMLRLGHEATLVEQRRPLRAARGGVRAPGPPRRRDRALRARAGRDRAAARPRDRGHRRRRGQHRHRSGRARAPRSPQGDRA